MFTKSYVRALPNAISAHEKRLRTTTALARLKSGLTTKAENKPRFLPATSRSKPRDFKIPSNFRYILEDRSSIMFEFNRQNTKDKPVNFGVILFPAFQALDIFGPLDALNVLSRTYQTNLYIIAASMDPVSTKLLTSQPADSNFEQRIMPTHTFENAPALDVLIVPGGQGTRAPGVVSAVEFVKKIYPSLQYLITVCTGSGLAARAGVLDGKRATTNKLSWDTTVALRQEVDWIHKARWVQDGNIWTSSGISAGIDVTFAWIEEVYGSDTARGIADRMEYDRVTDSTKDRFADLYISKV